MKKEIGFGGYSIAELSDLTSKLRFFKYLKYLGGIAEIPEEFSFKLKFSSEAKAQKCMENIKRYIEERGTNIDLAIEFKETDRQNRNIIDIRLFRKSWGMFEPRHFREAEAVERTFENDFVNCADTIGLPEMFESRGFDSKKYI